MAYIILEWIVNNTMPSDGSWQMMHTDDLESGPFDILSDAYDALESGAHWNYEQCLEGTAAQARAMRERFLKYHKVAEVTLPDNPK